MTIDRPTDSDRLGLALAVLSAATWSLAGVWVRLLPDVPLATIVGARLALALVAVLPVVVWQARRLVRPTPAAWALAVVMVGYYGCSVAAFLLAPVAEATLLINTSPLFAVLWALMRGETVRPGERWGAGLALSGVALILLPGLTWGAAADVQRVLGDALALGAALGMAVYAVAFGRLRSGGRAPTPLLVTALTFSFGAVGLAGLIGWQGGGALVGLDRPAAWGALAGLAVVTTAVPTFAYSVAAHRLPPVLSTTARLLTPAFAAVAAWLVLGEVPSVWLVPGGALVLSGLLLAIRSGRR